jgi:2-keto-4-pentenoate hydratase/2-oxohepta-3-ene-1,7-dioic acid hydratase in catechol pathway
MQLVTFQNNGSAEAGAIVEGKVIGLKSAGFPSLLSLIQGGKEALDRAKEWVRSPPTDQVIPLAKAKLVAPLPRPPKIICIGLNYRDHALECKAEIPKVPTVFSKYTTAIIGPGEAIVLPKNSKQPDYEGVRSRDRQGRPPHFPGPLAGTRIRLHQP